MGSNGTVFDPQSDGKQPGLIDPATGNSMLGREWEGIASTDYLVYEAYIMSPPNPDIAVGPDHILTIVNRTILAYPNPNAGGATTAVPVNLQPISRTVLTQWVGETVLNYVCPTLPRTNTTCVIGNASVRYDQMQGRYLVVFTATDTVVRAARWVMITSNWATFNPGTPGTTEVFTTPQPPGPSQANPNSGGVNPNWTIWYKDDETNTNLNQITDYFVGSKVGAKPPIINCAPGAAADTYCYFPTGARVGLSNDDIILTADVYNDNIPVAERTLANPAFRGTRVRIYKKASIYTKKNPIIAGAADHTAGGHPNPVPTVPTQGDFYDVWTNDGTCAAENPTQVGTTIFTVDPLIGRTWVAGEPPTCTAGLIRPVFYEPAHVRGRALASFSGNGNQNNAFTTLVGARSLMDQDSILYLRSITFTSVKPGNIVNAEGDNVNTPVIVGGIPTLRGLQITNVYPFNDPDLVTQRNKLSQPPNLATPQLNVGDTRPHRVIAREGHLYLARVGDPQSAVGWLMPGGDLGTTVIYNIIQKRDSTAAPATIMEHMWQNGQFFAPMFDVPANVIQYGSVSPINVLPYLEKLFVGTAYPPLSPSDPRPASGIWPYISSGLLSICTGMEPSVATNNLAYPGLFDIRCGEDAYDTQQLVRNAYTGAENNIYPWGVRGGAATDPNTLGLWTYGAYAKGRAAQISGPGQWGTYVAYYPLSFPPRDPYNNALPGYLDVPVTHPHFTFVQIAKQTEIEPGSRTAQFFNPDAKVKRREMARWVVRAQMDEAGITAYLNATGGTTLASFADVPTNHADYRYIETMYRRGYTKGCSATSDAVRFFCPEDNMTRGQMAVFLVRAKMNSVFPTVSSGATGAEAGCPATGQAPLGDLFGLYATSGTVFADSTSHQFCKYIAKLRELRISNGKTETTYAPNDDITRSELMVFLVRSFFQ